MSRFDRVWIVILILSVVLTTHIPPVQNERSVIRLATYWDTPGRVEAVVPDNRHIIIYDEGADKARLVEVYTGVARIERRGRESIRFSPDGQFLILYTRETNTYQIAETHSLRILIQILAGIPKFSADKRYMLNTWRDDDTPYQTQVIDLYAGEIAFEVRGMNAQISPDSRFVIVFDYTDRTTVISELPTGQSVFRITPAAASDNTYDSYKFSPDGHLLAVYQHAPNVTHLIDVGTWETRYPVTGFVNFNADSQFMVARFGDGRAAGVQLVQTETGEVLDETFGSMSFSPDGTILYRAEELSNEDWHIQAVNLATGEVVAEQSGWIAMRLIAENNILEVHDNHMHTTRFIDVATKKLLWEVEGSAWVFDEESLLAILDQRQVVNVVTGEILAVSDPPMIASSDGQLIFAPDEGLVDLYGAATAQVDTMPTPRP